MDTLAAIGDFIGRLIVAIFLIFTFLMLTNKR